MKYITQDWTSTKDGYLFFVQRLQEMLFHYSDDIVKAPVHNTHSAIPTHALTHVRSTLQAYTFLFTVYN